MIQKIDVYIVDYMCKCVGRLSLYQVRRLVLDIFIGIDITQRKRWSQHLCREIETHCQYPFINFVKLFVIAKSDAKHSRYV